jgi:membrane protein required for colicin V production
MFDLMLIDWIYIAVVVASTVWAFMRGGVFETVATMSWVLAALSARFVSPWLEVQLQGMFGLPEPTITTLISSYFIVFFVILILFSLFAQQLRDYIHSTFLRSADRSLGVIFGVVRGVFINGIIYILALWYWQGVEMPQYMREAKTRPIMQITALKIYEWFIPGSDKLITDDLKGKSVVEDYESLINPKVRAAQVEVSVEDTGYKNSERNSLDNQLLQLENIDGLEE